MSEVIAALALLLSGYATWRAHKFKKKEEELLDLQTKVNALILEKEQREAIHATRAELGASFLSLGSNRYRLKIFNRGKAAAHSVAIEFPDGNDAIPESELNEKFPLEIMEPGQSVELIAAVHNGTRRKQAVHLKWTDLNGKAQEKIVHATL